MEWAELPRIRASFQPPTALAGRNCGEGGRQLLALRVFEQVFLSLGHIFFFNILILRIPSPWTQPWEGECSCIVGSFDSFQTEENVIVGLAVGNTTSDSWMVKLPDTNNADSLHKMSLYLRCADFCRSLSFEICFIPYDGKFSQLTDYGWGISAQEPLIRMIWPIPFSKRVFSSWD